MQRGRGVLAVAVVGFLLVTGTTAVAAQGSAGQSATGNDRRATVDGPGVDTVTADPILVVKPATTAPDDDSGPVNDTAPSVVTDPINDTAPSVVTDPVEDTNLSVVTDPVNGTTFDTDTETVNDTTFDTDTDAVNGTTFDTDVDTGIGGDRSGD